jgi:hypothetical protein
MERRKGAVKGVLILVAVLVGGGGALVGAVYGYRAAFGAKVGERCEDHLSCKPGGICISHRCRQGCATDAACPAGWSCRDTSVTVTTEGALTGRDVKADTERISFSPAAMAPERAREQRRAAEQAEQDARIAAILKLQAVQNAVSLKTLPVFGKPSRLIGSADFDQAWAQIPESDRRTASADELADRIIQLAGAHH